MNDLDSILSRLLVSLIVIFCFVYGLDFYCGWRAVRRTTVDASLLKGQRVESLFERTPILPDRVLFCSRWPEKIMLEYDAGRWGMLKYPKTNIVIGGDIIEDAL